MSWVSVYLNWQGIELIAVMITAEEGPRTEMFCNPVKLMLCYKLNTLPVHHRHTAMNLYEIKCILIIYTYVYK